MFEAVSFDYKLTLKMAKPIFNREYMLINLLKTKTFTILANAVFH